MRDREGRGYFRGSEFSKLLILAGLLAIGWPLVIYYGFVSRPAARPAPRPIVEQAPLPPPDPAPEMVGIIDIRPRTFRDDVPMAYLLKKVRDDPPPGLSKTARAEILPADLLRNPKRYRGLPLRLEGYAHQVFAHDDEDKDVVPGGRLYEVWFRSDEHDQRLYPCTLWVENVPKTLPGGRGLEERVAFEGYFFRLLSYTAGDAARFAPMLVGRIAHRPGESAAPRPRSESRLWIFLPLGLLVVYLSVRMAFAVRKTRRPGGNRSARAVSDQIDPEDLDRWVRESEGDSE